MADFQTPQLIITNVGLAAAQVATPTGPFIEIDSFKIGSAYGYTPTRDDQDINGELLYQGAPLTYKYVGDNTLDIVCRLPAEAGPFQFGEVALFLSGGAMFAKAAFADLQIKYSSLGTNVLSTYTFNCLLRLDQAVAVFKINTNCLPPDIWEVDKWSDVYPPALSANPDIPSILVHEPDANGNATLITRSTDNQWSVAGNYHWVGTGTVVAATTTSLDFNASEISNVSTTSLANEYVVETPDGYLRSVSAVTTVGGSLRFTLNDALPAVQPVGAKIALNSMQTNQTLVQLSGDAVGQAIIKGKTVTLNVTLDKQSIASRSQTWTTAGTYTFVVPADTHFIYPDMVGAGGGGAGAGGGDSSADFPHYSDYSTNPGYRGGGGGGGGGAGTPISGQAVPVTPGETVTVVIGQHGVGGVGGAPGNSGQNGTAGTATTITGSFGTITAAGGQGGTGGDGYGAPSGFTGGGGKGGSVGGGSGIDGLVGCAGGDGGTSPHGTGGAGGRGATGNSITHLGAPGENGSGNGSGGGGAGSVYVYTSTDSGGTGGNGTDGYLNLTW